MGTGISNGTSLAALAEQYRTREDWIARELLKARIRRELSTEPLHRYELDRFARHMSAVSPPPPVRQAKQAVSPSLTSQTDQARAARKKTSNAPKVLDDRNKRAIVAALCFSDNEFLPWVLYRRLPSSVEPIRLLMLSEGRTPRTSFERAIAEFLQSLEFKKVKREVLAELRLAKATFGATLKSAQPVTYEWPFPTDMPTYKYTASSDANLPEREPLFDWDSWREQQ